MAELGNKRLIFAGAPMLVCGLFAVDVSAQNKAESRRNFTASKKRRVLREGEYSG